jgi:hypothetical protein
MLWGLGKFSRSPRLWRASNYLVSSSLLAGRSECSRTPGACSEGDQSGSTNNRNIASVSEPCALAFIGLGAAGLVFTSKRNR